MRKHYVGALVLTTYQPPILVLKIFKKTSGFHERTKILCRGKDQGGGCYGNKGMEQSRS
jgi:hypothetical protein